MNARQRRKECRRVARSLRAHFDDSVPPAPPVTWELVREVRTSEASLRFWRRKVMEWQRRGTPIAINEESRSRRAMRLTAATKRLHLLRCALEAR